MAHCERGYLCEVCREEVAEITDSDLYLRFILGEIDSRELLSTPDRHLRCNPVLSQYIVHPEFDPVKVNGPFSKDSLDPESVLATENRVTRGWQRLREVPGLGIPISEYPLDEVCRRKPSR